MGESQAGDGWAGISRHPLCGTACEEGCYLVVEPAARPHADPNRGGKRTLPDKIVKS